jgi:hypothetical protein
VRTNSYSVGRARVNSARRGIQSPSEEARASSSCGSFGSTTTNLFSGHNGLDEVKKTANLFPSSISPSTLLLSNRFFHAISSLKTKPQTFFVLVWIVKSSQRVSVLAYRQPIGAQSSIKSAWITLRRWLLIMSRGTGGRELKATARVG